jgi:tetratricopeptide (TPR) repeat protein
MIPRSIRKAAALILSLLFVCAQVDGQGSSGKQKNSQLDDTVRPDPKRAQKAVELGDKAQADGRLAEALAYYEQAARYAPRDAAIVGRAAALRSKIVRDYVEAAERDALAGYMDKATIELGAALRLDPGNEIVGERLREMQAMEDKPAAPEPADKGVSGLPELQPQGGKHNLNVRGDTKSVYEQVCAMFGVKAAFDPDLAVKNVRLRVDDVDFYTAISLVGEQTATFWRPLNATLLFVAPDTPDKHRQFGLQEEQTFALPSAVDNETMTELLRILRDITGATHINLDAHTRTITMRDTPDKLALAGQLIHEIDKERGEVMLEIELLEVDLNTARKLGITPPSSTTLFTIPPNILNQLKNAKDFTTLATLLASIFGGPAGGAAVSAASLIPPIIALGGGRTTFLLTLPGAAASFSDALSLVRSGRQILLRAQDGKPATFFVGDRFPVTLSLLSGSLGTSNFIPGLSNSILPTTDFAVGVGPVAIIAADFRNTGLLDLAVVNEIDNSLTILLNQGIATGQFVAASTLPIQLGPPRTTAPASPPAIASAALTSSGFHDLLITDPTTNEVIVLLSNGDGTFTAATGSPISVGKEPSAIVTADFNADGNQDFAVTNFTDSTVSLFNGNGMGGFTQATTSPITLPTASQNPVGMVLGDFNADGITDLAVLTSNNAPTLPGNVVVFLGGANETFTPAGTATTVGKGPVAIAAGDLNADGRTDLAVVNQVDNSVSVLLNNGDATFTAAPNSPLTTGTTPTGLAIADFNQDGIIDIAVTNDAVNSVSVFLGLGLGIFAPAFELPSGANPSAILSASLSGATSPDVAITDDPTGTAGQVQIIFSPAALFSNATSGIAQQPYPGSEYIDLGVKVKATPALHPNDEVTLQLEFEIRALAGTSVNGIPVISNRTLTQTVRVRENETSVIGGITDREETRSITGLPGFAELPGPLGYVFGARNNTLADTQLMILVTPRRLRRPDRQSRTIFAGRGEHNPVANPNALPSERERTNP